MGQAGAAVRYQILHGLMLMGALLGSAQEIAQAPDTVYHLHGSVVDGVTGKAVGRVLVTSADRRLATLTDSAGNFAIDVSVPAAAAARDANAPASGVGRFAGNVMDGSLPMVRLEAQRPGYLPGSDVTLVALTAQGTEAAVRLQLFPAAAVRGHIDSVTDRAGRGRTVLLLQRMIRNGRSQWSPMGGRTAEPDGSFAFADLAPGEYTVMTRELPVPVGRSLPGRNGGSNVSEQYPPTYLGGTATLAAATHLNLRYGQVAQVSLAPRAASYYPVVVPVKGIAANTPMSVTVSRDGERFSGFELRWNAAASQVEGSLPDGDYTLLMNQFGPTHAFATAPLHVAGGPLTLSALATAPTQDLSVRVHDERQGSRNSQGPPLVPGNGFSLYLQPELQGLPGASTQVRNGELVLQNVVAGSYWVEPVGWQGYVASLTSGGTDLLRSPLVVSEAGTAPIDVTLRDDGGTVQGSVAVPEGEAGRYVVVLLPTDGSARAMEMHTAPGKTEFSLRNVPPGSYRAFARRMHDRTDEIAYREPEAMRVYDGVGAAVQVLPGGTAQVTVPVVRAEAAR